MSNAAAEPIVKGILPTIRQSFGDLFRWKVRTEIIEENEYGESTVRYEWQDPPPLVNPISLFAQLTATNWVFFIVGFLAWTAVSAPKMPSGSRINPKLGCV